MEQTTAILVNYHCAADIAQAVHSVLVDAPSVRVVVVDNSESIQEAQRLRHSLPVSVELLVADRNLGFGVACNWAAVHAPSDYYWLVNPDVRVQPGCLAALLNALKSDPVLGAVAPRQCLDLERKWLFSPSWLPASIDTWVRERALREPAVAKRYGRAVRAESLKLWGATTKPVLQRALSGAAMLVRRHCLPVDSSLFDPAYFMYFEDSDLCRRLRRAGWRMAVVPLAEAVHLWRMGGHKNDLMERSAPVYFNQHFRNSPWLTKAQTVIGHDAVINSEMPIWYPDRPPQLPVSWTKGWSVEISPLEVFLPSVGQVGFGSLIPWPKQVVDAVGGVPLFARLGSLGAGQEEAMILALNSGE